MAIQVFGAPATVIMLNRAFGNTNPGNLIYTNQVAAATANATQFANDFAASYASLSNSALATQVLTNLGLLPNAALATALTDYYAANGAGNRGAVTLQLCNILATREGDATYGAAALAWNNTVASGYTYSANTANVNSGSGSAGQTFTLTTGSDNRVGGAGDDTFDAGLSSGSLQTLNSSDVLNGGAGTDYLVAVLNSSVTPRLTSVEDVSITAATNSLTADFANSTGIVTLSSSGSTGAGNTVTISGISKAVGVTIRDTSMAHTITYNDVSGTTDSATVNVSNLSQATGVVTSILGVETLTLNSSGSPSSTTTTGIGTLTSTNTTRLNITGDKALNIVDNLGTSVLTVDASAASGGVNLDFGAGSMTVTGGSGNDDFSFEAVGDVTVDSGAGNDTIRFDATGTYTTADTVSGGDGNDTLSATAANLVTASAAAPTIYRTTGIEKISANTALADGATINIANISTVANRLEITAASSTAAGGETYVFNVGASTLELDSAISAGGTQTVSVGGAATNDALTIINGTTSATDVLGGLALTSTGFETLTINTTGTGAAGAQTVGAITATASPGGTPSLVIAGTNGITTGVITATSGSIDASSMTVSAGIAGLTMVTGQNTASTITGSSGDDVLFGAITTAVSQRLTGGAGNDNITAGGGNDVITGGDGDDTINGGAGNDNIDGGAGNDRVNITADANLGSADTITGGDGTDIFSIQADMTDSAATLQAVSGFEVFEVASGTTDTITASNFINNQTFTRIDFDQGGGGTLTVNNVGLAVTTMRMNANAAADTLVFDRLIDNSTNELTIQSRSGMTVTAVTVDDEETLNISGHLDTSDTVITTLNAADLVTLNITGAADITVTNAVVGTIVQTVNASAATGAVAIRLTNNVRSATMTSGDSAALFTGGLLADTITTGAGADTIVGGDGADTISVGSGNDTVTGGNGADVINVGSGTDEIVLGADASTAVTSLTTSGTSSAISITGADVVTGMAVGDVIRVTGLGYTNVGANAGSVLLAAADTNLGNGIVDNTFALIRGSWAASTTTGSGTFIADAAGLDTLFVIDAAEATNAQSFEAVVLVGTRGVTSTAAAAAGEVTITLA